MKKFKNNKRRGRSLRLVLCLALSLIMVSGVGSTTFAQETDESSQETIPAVSDTSADVSSDQDVNENQEEVVNTNENTINTSLSEVKKGASIKEVTWPGSGVDRTESVKVTNVSMTLNKQGDAALDMKNAAGEPSDYTNGLSKGDTATLEVEWAITLAAGETLTTGDYFELTMTSENLKCGNIADWGDMVDSSNTKVGEFRFYNGKIQAVLTEEANGKGSISSIKFRSGKGAFSHDLTIGYDKVDSFSVGTSNSTVTKYYKINGQALTKNLLDSKAGLAPTNNHVSWYYGVGQKERNELWDSQGTTVDARESYVWEDTFEDAIDVDDFRICANLKIPVSPSSAAGVSNNTALDISVTSKFTEVKQTNETDYAAFKEKVCTNPLQWGIYKSDAGVYTAVINFGDLDNTGIKWSDIDSSLDTTFDKQFVKNLVEKGYCPNTETDIAAAETWANNAYGDGNVINGQVTSFVFWFGATYDTVLEDTVINNTDSRTFTGGTDARSATTTLSGILGEVKVDPYGAMAIKVDNDTNAFISGTKFKLQISDGAGGWTDYTPADGLGLVRTTNASGEALFSSLGVGTYRFVEVEAAPGYDLSKTSGYDATDKVAYMDPFTVVNNETEGHKVVVKNEKKTYTVTYSPGDQGTFTDDVHSNIKDGTATPAYAGVTDTATTNDSNVGKPAGNVGFHFTGWSPTVADTVTGDVTYVAQWAANSGTKYKVEHYKMDKEGEYPTTATEIENKTGTTGGEADATPKTYDGYTNVSSKTTYEDGATAASNTVLTISADGSLVIKLYYEKNVTVSFNTHGGDYTPDDQKFNTGGTATKPDKDPTKEENTFLGWFYQDAAGNWTEWDFDTKVYEDIVLHARWEAKDPKLAIEKTLVTTGEIKNGQTLDYKIVVTNNGEGTAYDAVVKDTPQGLDFKSWETTAGITFNQDSLTWTIAKLSPGESITIDYKMVVKAGVKKITNKAIVTPQTGDDPSETPDITREIKTNEPGRVIKDTSADTGDDTNMMGIGAILLLSAMVVIGFRRKHN